jgi:hypothetical protein
MINKWIMQSGAQLRAFRCAVTQTSNRPPKKITRTLKFPLEETDFFDNPDNFEAATALYQITEGIGTESIYGLLMRLHLAGFRLFASSNEARTFCNRSSFDNSAFRQALLDTFGVQSKHLDIEAIYLDLRKQRRAINGKVKALSAQALAESYYLLATGSVANPDKPNFNKAFFSFLYDFGQALEGSFASWAEVNADITCSDSTTLTHLDHTIKQHGLNLPSVKQKITQLRDLKPENCPVVFDGNKIIVEQYPDDIAIHIVTAQYLQEIQSTKPSRKQAVDHVQGRITTQTHNGLSWLLGVGLDYLATTNIKQIAQDWNTSKSAELQQLVDIAKALLPVPFLDNRNYAKYRRSVGGKLDSWLANYINRLFDLQGALESTQCDFALPKALSMEDASAFFTGMTVNYTEFSALIETLNQTMQQAESALQRLFGCSTSLPDAQDVQAIEQLSKQLNTVSGLLNMLDNRLEQERKIAKDNSQQQKLELLDQCAFDSPDWLKELPKLNAISGGVPDYQQQLQQTAKDFNLTYTAMHQHYARIKNYCSKQSIALDVLGNITAKEQQYIERFKTLRTNAKTAESPLIRAHRNILHRIAKVASNCSPVVREQVRQLFLDWGVFKSKKHLNSFFINRKGAIYQSLFSRSNHQPYALDETALANTNYLQAFSQYLNKLEQQCNDNFALYSDSLALRKVYYTIMLSGLLDDLPAEIGQIALPEHLLNLSPILKAALEQQTLRAETLIKVFNYYHSLLNGFTAFLVRDEFIVRTKFTRVADIELIYQAKNKIWQVPEHYIKSPKAIGKVLAQLPLNELLNDNQLNVPEGIEALSKHHKKHWATDTRNGELTDFLRQSPHDWKYQLGYGQTEQQKQSGFKCFGKKNKRNQNYTGHTGLVRLIGPSTTKEWLDKAMLTNQAEIGDITLLIDQHIKQTIDANNVGISLKTQPADGQITLAVPVTEWLAEDKENIFDYFVAIDLGEVGIGYAVFAVDGFNLIAQGNIAIRSIRNLIGAVNRHRGNRQPRQKFQASYQPQLARLRNNAIGDTLGVIDGLMQRFNGFPIFESSVGSFERGARQLKMIYESVLKNYTFSNVGAHKATRKHHWCGGDRWLHPSLQVWEINKKGENTGKKKPLNLFPGASVHPAGTSQTCSQCGRNPLQGLRSFTDKNRRHPFIPNINSEYQLPSGESIYLYTYPTLTTQQQRERRRQKLNPQPTERMSKELYGDEIIKAIKRCLRFKPDSSRSKDTSQSQYRCLYSDCGHAMHADENAAINIGNKWMNTKLVRNS